MGEMLQADGVRARQLRLFRNFTQRELAANAGVGLKALRRFESTGEGTTWTAIRIAMALGVQDGFTTLFEAPPVQTLAEAEAQLLATRRLRARKKATARPPAARVRPRAARR